MQEATLKRISQRTALAVLVALIVGSLAWLIAAWAAGPFVVEFTDGERMTVGIGNVVFATAVGTAGGGLLAWVTGRLPRPRLIFVAVAAGILLASFTMPMMAGVDAETRLVLAALHGVVGAVVIGALAPALPSTRGVTA